jgi:ankyrin repeat protein
MWNSVQFLLKRGADAMVQAKDGRTPLDLATEKEHVDIVCVLLEHEKRVLTSSISYTRERLELRSIVGSVSKMRSSLYTDSIAVNLGEVRNDTRI